MNIGGFFASTATSSAPGIAIPLAMAAAPVPFRSPCILPLVPGLRFGAADPTQPSNRRRVLGCVGLFVLGFAAVFTLCSAALGAIGSWLLRRQDPMRSLGVVVILMGAVPLGLVPWLQQTRKLTRARRPAAWHRHRAGMNTLHGADTERRPLTERDHRQRGPRNLLAFAYCLGRGIPFALTATGLGWVSAAPALRRPTHPDRQYRPRFHAPHPGRTHGHRRPGAMDLSPAKTLSNVPHAHLTSS